MGSQFPNQGSNPCPLQWKHRVLAAGLPVSCLKKLSHVSLEEGMAMHFSILAWRILWTEKPGGLQSLGLQRGRHDWATECVPSTFLSLRIALRLQWAKKQLKRKGFQVIILQLPRLESFIKRYTGKKIKGNTGRCFCLRWETDDYVNLAQLLLERHHFKMPKCIAYGLVNALFSNIIGLLLMHKQV